MTGRGRDEADLEALLKATRGTHQERCGLSDTIAALRALPLGQGEILMLRLGAGLPVHAVSDVVGSDDQTVRRAQARALERLEVEADLVAWSLGAPPTAAELADERVALAAYRHIPRPPAWAVPRTRVITVGRPPAGSRAGRRTALGIANAAGRSRTALLAISAFSAAVMSLGGLSAAAYVGALPSGVQQVMHEAIGAPAPTVGPLRAKRTSQAVSRPAPVTTTAPLGRAAPAPGSPSRSSAPALPLTPDVPVANLCRQWSAHRTAGTGDPTSNVFRDLTAAAGGADRVTLFCAAAAATSTATSTASVTATPTVTAEPVPPTSAPATTTSPEPSPTPPSSPTQSPSAPSSTDTGVPVPAPTTQTTDPSSAPTTAADGGATQGPASDQGSSPTGAPQPTSTTGIAAPPG